MALNWRTSWVVGGLAVMVIVLCGVSLWKMPRQTNPSWKGIAPPMSSPMLKVGNALAYQAAEESARLLGSDSGSVVLVVPEDVIAAESSRQSLQSSFKEGFLDALQRHPKIQLDGVLVKKLPFKLNLVTLQDIQKNHPKSGVIVSFVGLPQLSEEEQQTWLASNPPKLVAIEFWGLTERSGADAALANGLVDAVFAFNRPPPDTDKPTREDIIRQSIDVLRRP